MPGLVQGLSTRRGLLRRTRRRSPATAGDSGSALSGRHGPGGVLVEDRDGLRCVGGKDEARLPDVVVRDLPIATGWQGRAPVPTLGVLEGSLTELWSVDDG